MSDVLTMAEIEAKYDGEWVLIADPEVDENLDVKKGTVIFHSRDRDEFDRKSLDFRLPHAAVRYNGDIPEDMAIVL